MTKILRNWVALLAVVTVMDCHSPVRTKVRLDKHDSRLVQQGKFLNYINKPFSGVLEEAYGPGQVKTQAEYRNGLLNGSLVTWYPDGSTESVRTFENGEKEGVHKGWWQNGQLRFEYNFIAGLYQGAFMEWYESGNPLHDFTYDKGEVVSAVGWRENGKAYMNYVVRNGRKYGLTNARLCFSLKDEKGSYITSTN